MVTQTRIKQRFDTEQNWLSSDVVLLDGELAVVSCNQQIRFKVGNGVSSFSQLKYVDQDQLSTVLVTAHAISQGSQSHSTPFGLAAGWHLSANADFSQALGVRSQTSAGHSFSFVWNGNQVEYPPVQIGTNDYYTSHGEGTFNINPLSGTSGFYIGEQTLQQALDAVSASAYEQISAMSADLCSTTSSMSQTYVDGTKNDLSVQHISMDDYAALVQTSAAISNVLYVVSSLEHADAFGMQVKNVAPAIDLSDAVNLEQLMSAVGSIELTDYYLKSETSSASQISTALTSYYKKNETSSSTQLNTAFSNYYKKNETSSAIEISAEADALSHAISEKSKVTFVYWND